MRACATRSARAWRSSSRASCSLRASSVFWTRSVCARRNRAASARNDSVARIAPTVLLPFSALSSCSTVSWTISHGVVVRAVTIDPRRSVRASSPMIGPVEAWLRVTVPAVSDFTVSDTRPETTMNNWSMSRSSRVMRTPAGRWIRGRGPSSCSRAVSRSCVASARGTRRWRNRALSTGGGSGTGSPRGCSRNQRATSARV